MTFAIVDKNQLPKSSPRYAQTAATFRAMGIKIKDGEYERIDSLATSSQFNSCMPLFLKHGWSEASKETDAANLLIISALLENNSVSQDSKDDLAAELLIAGHLPQTKPFLLN